MAEHDSGGIFFSGEAHEGWMAALDKLRGYNVQVNERDWQLQATGQPDDSDEVGVWLVPIDESGFVITGAERQFFKWSDIDRIYIY